MSGIEKKKVIKWIAIGAAALLLLLLLLKAWRIGKPAWSLYGAYRQAQEFAANPAAIDPAQVQPMAHQAHNDLAALQKELQPFNGLLRRLGWFPRYGGELAAAPSLLAMGVSLSEVGDIGLTAFEPVLPYLLDREANPASVDELIPLVVDSLAAANADFERARQSLAQAVARRAEIDADTLSPRTAKLLSLLDRGLPLLELALETAPVASNLLGADAPRSYLLIAQNDDELRATGGFISAVGVLVIERGQIAGLTIEDSYAVDDFSQTFPEAPPPLARYMQAPFWVFRDANWSPDFPTSARTMLDLYQISREAEVDGVIAVDQAALQRLVGALEPVTISGWEEAATGKNVIKLIRESWSPETGDGLKEKGWWQNRKNFMGDLVSAMRERVESDPESVDWGKLLAATLDILDERHIQIWLADERAQAIIAARGWDGAIQSATGDYLMVVDTNVGFNKVNAVIESAINYQVQLTEGETITATLTVTHTNNSAGTNECGHRAHYGSDYWDIINRCYWNYLRIYTPLGSELQQATPHAISGKYLLSGRDEPARVVDLPAEAGKSVWGTLVLVPNGEAVETTFRYALPPNTFEKTETGGRYRLLLQKQAGSRQNQVRVVIQLPPNKRLARASPPPASITEGQAVFNLSLVTDQEIEIEFE